MSDGSQKKEYYFKANLKISDKDPFYDLKTQITSQYSDYAKFWVAENPSSKEHDFPELFSLYRIIKYDDVDNPQKLEEA